jgi:hypothetical protein
MSEIVPASEIEAIVGIERHATRHYARAVSAEETVYILHSHRCKDGGRDLRECFFSLALDNGIDVDDWAGAIDQAVRVTITRSQRLVPALPGVKVAR